MMDNSLTRFCIAACVFTLLISLSMNLVVGIHAFGDMAPSPLLNGTSDAAKTKLNAIEGILSGNIEVILGLGGILTLLAIAGCIASGNYSIIGPVIFIYVFWGSWGLNLSLFDSSGYFSSGTMLDVYHMITLGMSLLFVGALIGLFGGND